MTFTPAERAAIERHLAERGVVRCETPTVESESGRLLPRRDGKAAAWRLAKARAAAAARKRSARRGRVAG